MAYTTNPHASKARGDAVRLVKLRGYTQSQAARYTGVSQGTISKWVRKAPDDLRKNIPTVSSRPQYSPNALSEEIVSKIREVRLRHNRCAPVVHKELSNKGIRVSLSSVKRTLRRQGLIKEKSKWKRYRPHIPRPLALYPGALVQVDTIHYVDIVTGERKYIYTLIDLFTRKTYAEYSSRISAKRSLEFILRAERYLGFKFSTVQTDNGPEFSKYFDDELRYRKITLRHSRVRKPNDNAHIERFNRTIQEECIGKYIDEKTIERDLKRYLYYYNEERLHLGIQLTTPNSMLKNYSKVLN